VFLDRDGVLNQLVARNGQGMSPRGLAEFALLPGVRPAVAALQQAGLLAIVVTNQPDIARGALAQDELDRMHAELLRAVRVDAIYTCPHDDRDACACRKPKPGLLEKASRIWDVALAESFLVGDSRKDVAAGKAAGCTTILIGSCGGPPGEVEADFVARDLPAATELILEKLDHNDAARLLTSTHQRGARKAQQPMVSSGQDERL